MPEIWYSVFNLLVTIDLRRERVFTPGHASDAINALAKFLPMKEHFNN